MHYQAAFTFVELLVVLVLLSVLAFFAIPNYSALRHRWQLTLSARQLCHNLRWARNQAVFRHQSIQVQAENHNYWLSEGDVTLKKVMLPQIVVRWQGFPARSQLVFTAMGFTNVQNGTFYLRSTTDKTRQIIINQAGRIRC